MYLIILILLIAIIMIIMLFKYAANVRFIFDTEKEDMNITFLWLYPFFKAVIYMQDYKPVLKLFLFNINIYEKSLKAKKRFPRGLQLVNDIKFNDINLTAYYGFRDKSLEGLVCGFINYAAKFIKFDEFEHNPDFLAVKDYIYIEANANISIMPTLKKLLQH